MTEQTSQQPVIIQQTAQKSGWSTFLKLLALLLFVCSFCSIFTFAILLFSNKSTDSEKGVDNQTYTYISGKKTSENKLLAVYIDQPILTSAQDYNDDLVTALLVGQYTFGYKIKDDLMKAVDDPTIKGVVLFINSPGGTIVGARAIADGVSYYREKTHKPVYAYVQDMAASGAYWAAASTDKIYAEQGSLVGSIGVILGPFEYYNKLVSLGGVSAENGIEINYITGGQYKDIGNPTRKITPEEVKILQAGINSEYAKFVEYVSTRRNIPEETIKKNIKALVYGTDEATQYGLIDAVGNREDVLAAIADKAGIGSDYKVIKVGTSTTLFGSLFSSLSKVPAQKSEAPARLCALCGKPLYFYGNPLEY